MSKPHIERKYLTAHEAHSRITTTSFRVFSDVEEEIFNKSLEPGTYTPLISDPEDNDGWIIIQFTVLRYHFIGEDEKGYTLNYDYYPKWDKDKCTVGNLVADSFNSEEG